MCECGRRERWRTTVRRSWDGLCHASDRSSHHPTNIRLGPGRATDNRTAPQESLLTYQSTVAFLHVEGPSLRHILFWPHFSMRYDCLRRTEQHEGRASTLAARRLQYHDLTVDTFCSVVFRGVPPSGSLPRAHSSISY